MAKDPAFLFYSQDFLVGTLTMSFEDKGKYITILAYMHQEGRLDEKTISLLVGSISDNLRLKFSIDEKGLFYNKKLESEIEKRIKFSESRRNNGLQGGRPKKKSDEIKSSSKALGLASANLVENENENENEINNRKGIIKNLCKIENSDLVLSAFEKWRDYLQKQHSITLLENEYTYDVLIDAIKRVKDGNVVKSIDYSINSGTYKKIYPFKEDIKFNVVKSKEQKHDETREYVANRILEATKGNS